MKRFLHKLIDVICFIVGPTTLAVGLFNFVWTLAAFGGAFAPREHVSIGIGVALIAAGFLRLHWLRTERQSGNQP
jgi:hypothetical protein